MKSIRIQAVFLAFILMMPEVFASTTWIADAGDKYELCENSTKERQSEERKSQEKEASDDVEEFIFHSLNNFVTIEIKGLKYFARSNQFTNINTNVLTPPPEATIL